MENSNLNQAKSNFQLIYCYIFYQKVVIWLDAIIMSRTRFRVNLHSIVVRMSRNSLLEASAISEA